MIRTSVIYNFNETTQGWSGEGAVAVTRVTSPVYEGLGALQASDAMTAGFDSLRFNDGSALRDLTPNGTTITAWVYVPADATGTNWQAHLEIQDPSFAWQVGPNQAIVPGYWTKLTYTPPTSLMVNCRAIGVQVEANDVNRTQAVYFDFVVGELVIPDSSRWAAQLLTTAPANELLDLPRWQGQRSSTFEFEVINGVTGEHKGLFHPVRNRTPRLSHDSSRTISRTLDLTFTPDETVQFNVLQDRVLIWMLLSDGTRWPLGKYMATDRTRIPQTSGEYASVQFVDEMFVIDQAISQAFAPTIDTNGDANALDVRYMIQLLLKQSGFILDIDESDFRSASNWSIGTSKAKIVKDLALEGAYLNPWFNHAGHLKLIRSFDPMDRIPTIDLDTNDRVIRDSIAYTDDLLSASNRFIVVSNSGLESTPRIGIYDVPASAPYSADNRGFIIPIMFNISSETQNQAQAMARTLGQQTEIYERVTLDTTIDPRHDGYDVVRWNGVNWLELSWQMDLTEGGTMSHTMRRVYQ
jgi:hypothetical protein